MTMICATQAPSSSVDPSDIEIVHLGPILPGPFMLTLCPLDAQAAIRPPQSPELRRFTFLRASVRDREGGEQVYLHMGYFASLAHAQSVLEIVRRRFPHATASRTPANLPQSALRMRAVHLAAPHPAGPADQSPIPVAEASLTDTQVMRILETRSTATEQSELGEHSSAQIGVLRPEDTSTRRALKEAVVRGAPVFFAVQLDWSARPIDPGRVPPLPVFRTHTLYASESRREGRRRYFLRLGFFADAAAAKEAALGVRAKFAAAVVVPVTSEEIARVHESTNSFGFAQVCVPSDPGVDHSGAGADQSGTGADQSGTGADRSGTGGPPPRPRSTRARSGERRTETLEQTLETLAAREMWSDPDSLSDTGVRHLKVEVLERKSGSS